jgi:DNA-directed RNA polymerase subunit beta'
MGHIRLAAPVCHTWYLRSDPSPLSLLLDIKPRLLEEVLLFESYLVTSVDRRHLDEAREALSSTRGAWLVIDEPEAPEAEAGETCRRTGPARRQRSEKASAAVRLLGGLAAGRVISPDEWHRVRQFLRLAGERLGKDPGPWVRAGTGAEAVRERLAGLDRERLERELKQQIAAVNEPLRGRLRRRLEVLQAFDGNRPQPEWMFLEVLPVLPPEHRPMIQRGGSRWSISDLNDLYRRVIHRNDRLKKLIEVSAPEAIIHRERRHLQEAVDALLDNARQAHPVLKSRKTPLSSLSDCLAAEVRLGARGRGKTRPRTLRIGIDRALPLVSRYQEILPRNQPIPAPQTLRVLCALCHKARALGLRVALIQDGPRGPELRLSLEDLLDDRRDRGELDPDWDDMDPGSEDLD